MSTQRDYIQTALRLPRDLHAALQQSGKDAERSFNAEMIYRLRSTFPKAEDASSQQNQRA